MELERTDLTSTIVRTRLAAPGSHPSESPRGERIGSRYEVLARIGVGGTAEVVAADDLVLRRQVAIKRPRADRRGGSPGALAREARVLARMRHRGVVRLYDHVVERGRDHLILEHVTGGTLAAQRGAMTPASVARVGVAVAEALAHVHARGVLHLDVKAENVLLDDHGPRLIDFGISECDAVLSGSVVGLVGTPRAMAPEQVLGAAVDARTDLFAFGVLLYELLVGVSPFSATTIDATLRRVVECTPEPIQVPGCAALADSIHHLLEKEPAMRPQSAVEVGVRLAAIASRLARAASAAERGEGRAG